MVIGWVGKSNSTLSNDWFKCLAGKTEFSTIFHSSFHYLVVRPAVFGSDLSSRSSTSGGSRCRGQVSIKYQIPNEGILNEEIWLCEGDRLFRLSFQVVCMEPLPWSNAKHLRLGSNLDAML
jgi:hypothetical protein